MSKVVRGDDLTEEQALALIRKHKVAARLIGLLCTLDYGDYHGDGDCLEGACSTTESLMQAMGLWTAKDEAESED